MTQPRLSVLSRFVRFCRQRPRLGNFRRGRRPVRHRKGAHVLDVLVKSKKEERRERSGRWRAGIKAGVVVLGVLGGVVGVQSLVARHFWNSDDLLVGEADLQTTGTLTHEEILRRAGLAPAMHVYAVDLRAVREKLEALPNVRHATVERELPGRLVIRLEERLPVAWLTCDNPELSSLTTDAHRGACLLDEDGHVFLCTDLRPELMTLPVIHVRRLSNVLPGTHVTAEPVQGGLALLQLIRDRFGARGLDVVEIDSPNDWSLVVKLTDDSAVIFGYEDFSGQLQRLTHIFDVSAARNRRLATVNLLPEKNVPVTFVGGASLPTGFEASPPALAPAPAAKAAPTGRPPLRSPATQAQQLDDILGGGR